MQFTYFLGCINLMLSMIGVGMLVHHLAYYVDRETTPLRTRLYVWALAVYFFFQAVGSAMYIVGIPPTMYFQDSVLLKLLCDYRPSQSHILLAALGLLLTVWLHRAALRHTNTRK